MVNVPGWRVIGWKVGKGSLDRAELSLVSKELFAAAVPASLLKTFICFDGRIGPAVTERFDAGTRGATLALLLEVFSVKPSL